MYWNIGAEAVGNIWKNYGHLGGYCWRKHAFGSGFWVFMTLLHFLFSIHILCG